jgi:hypothetical protein
LALCHFLLTNLQQQEILLSVELPLSDCIQPDRPAAAQFLELKLRAVLLTSGLNPEES